MASGIFRLPQVARLDGMSPSIKGAFGKNQGFRAFTAFYSAIPVIAFGRKLVLAHRWAGPS